MFIFWALTRRHGGRLTAFTSPFVVGIYNIIIMASRNALNVQLQGRRRKSRPCAPPANSFAPSWFASRFCRCGVTARIPSRTHTRQVWGSACTKWTARKIRPFLVHVLQTQRQDAERWRRVLGINFRRGARAGATVLVSQHFTSTLLVEIYNVMAEHCPLGYPRPRRNRVHLLRGES
jgi:hypothetical protein